MSGIDIYDISRLLATFGRGWPEAVRPTCLAFSFFVHFLSFVPSKENGISPTLFAKDFDDLVFEWVKSIRVFVKDFGFWVKRNGVSPTFG
jgi:hypothetical protein